MGRSRTTTKKLGFYKIAKYYYYPGWWEGGTALHFFINSDKWDALPKAYKSLLTIAAATPTWTFRRDTTRAIRRRSSRLVAAGTLLRPFSQAVMEACLKRRTGNAETSATNPDFKKILDSQMPSGTTASLVAGRGYSTNLHDRTRPKG